jgi:hypothetical protein
MKSKSGIQGRNVHPIQWAGKGWVFSIVLFALGVLAYGGWKLWPLARGAHGFYKEMQRQKNLPNPVVVKDGVYWFPLGGRVFAVPEAYVVSYGRNSTDGKLHGISLHALLPDFTGRTPENLARFKTRGWGDRIEVMVYATRASTQDEVERHNYYKIYLYEKDRLEKREGKEPEIISNRPRVEKIRELTCAPHGAACMFDNADPPEKLYELDAISGNDHFYLIEGDRVKKNIRCTIKLRDYQSPSCKAFSVFRDRIRLYFTFSRAYEKDWIAISDHLADWLASFERPLNAFPHASIHQEHKP